MDDESKLKEQWNKVYDEFKGKRHSVWRESASDFFIKKIDFLKKQNLKSVLDAGCGDGRNLIEFVKAGFEVTGLDLSDSALNKCRKLCKGYSNVKFLERDIKKLDFEKKFDIVICDFVMAHMEKPEKTIEIFYKSLKAGGFALIEFTSTEDPLLGLGKKIGERECIKDVHYIRVYTLGEIKKLLGKFEIISIEPRWYTDPYHGSGYCRKKRHKHHSFFAIAKKNK